MTDLCPHCGQPMPPTTDYAPDDKRAADWRLRIRLYAQGTDEPVVDTDPDLSPDQPGTWTCRGLPAMGALLHDTAEAFHGTPTSGLDTVTLTRRIRGLRPTLSRRGGNAVFRVPYSTPGHDWQARVDLERI